MTIQLTPCVSSALICWADAHEGAAAWAQAVFTPVALLIAAASIVVPAWLERRSRYEDDLPIFERAVPVLIGIQMAVQYYRRNVENGTADYIEFYEALRSEFDGLGIDRVKNKRLRRALASAQSAVMILSPHRGVGPDGKEAIGLKKFSPPEVSEMIAQRTLARALELQTELEVRSGGNLLAIETGWMKIFRKRRPLRAVLRDRKAGYVAHVNVTADGTKITRVRQPPRQEDVSGTT